MVDYMCVCVYNKMLPIFFGETSLHLRETASTSPMSLLCSLSKLHWDISDFWSPAYPVICFCFWFQLGMDAFWFSSSRGPASSNCCVCGHIPLVFHPTLPQGSAFSQTHTQTKLSWVAVSFVSRPATLQESDLIPWVIFLSCCLLLMWFLGDPNENVWEVVSDVADIFRSCGCLLG